MSYDAMLTFLEGILLAREGKDPSEAIELQEKRGQCEVVRKQRLPKKINDHSVPREIFFKGVSDDMSYDDRKVIVDQNLIQYTREQYEKMGIEIISDHDDLFWNVSLPNGWEVRATDHTMWNELVDSKGRKRASFFYKAAFYDRSAFINFETRYHISTTHNTAEDADYDIWRAADFIGVVKDGNKIIYSTETIPVTDDYEKDQKAQDELYDKVEKYIKENYPNYKDIHAYWD